MGYTHYLQPERRLRDEEWKRFQAHAARIIGHAMQYEDIRLAGPLGTGRPECSRARVAFNGSEAHEEDYESCIIGRTEQGFSFCKTAHRPYDPVVGAVYLAFQAEHGDGCLSSDGNLDGEEWACARELFDATRDN